MSDLTPIGPDNPRSERKSRYTGALSIDTMVDEEIDVTAVENRGRPEIDLTPYVERVAKNYSLNVNRPKTGKVQAAGLFRSDAIGTAKSRFSAAAKELSDSGNYVKGVGLSWFATDTGDLVFDEETGAQVFATKTNSETGEVTPEFDDNGNPIPVTIVKLGFVAGERIEGRGRKPKETV